MPGPSIEEALRSGAVLASVKPLEWRGIHTVRDWASCPFGRYEVGIDGYWTGPDNVDGSEGGIEAAKAAAQADYSARILSALSPDPALVALIEERNRFRAERDDLQMVLEREDKLVELAKAGCIHVTVSQGPSERGRALAEAEAERDRLKVARDGLAIELRDCRILSDGHRQNADEHRRDRLAAEARALTAEAKCDAAFAFITKLVHMQSGQGWTRAVVRGAAANFLESQGVSIAPGVDTTPEMIARALTQETNDG